MKISLVRMFALVLLMTIAVMSRTAYAQHFVSSADVATDDSSGKVLVTDVLSSAGLTVFCGEVEGGLLLIEYIDGMPVITVGDLTIENEEVVYRDDVDRIEIRGLRDGQEVRARLYLVERDGQPCLVLQTSDARGYDGITYEFNHNLTLVMMSKCRCFGKGGSTGACTLADCTNNTDCGTRPPGAGHNAKCQHRGARKSDTSTSTR